MPLDPHDLPSGQEFPPRHASNGQQERFWLLQNAFMAELCQNMEGIAEEFPTIGKARRDLAEYVERHPNVAFRMARPEVLQETHQAGEKLCPR